MRFQINKPIRLIELFSGIGTQAMSLRDLGANFERYRSIEFDRFAVASYNAIHDTNFQTVDICNIHGDDLGIVDKEHYTYITVYSFPCSDISVAGKRAGMKKGTGTRSGLLWEVERLLNELNALHGKDGLPDVLIMENVPQVVSAKNLGDFTMWIKALDELGYSSNWALLNSKNYGVAQNRNRCYMISLLGDYEYEFPTGMPLTKCMKDYLDEDVDERYYVNNDKAKVLIDNLLSQGKFPESYED